MCLIVIKLIMITVSMVTVTMVIITIKSVVIIVVMVIISNADSACPQINSDCLHHNAPSNGEDDSGNASGCFRIKLLFISQYI